MVIGCLQNFSLIHGKLDVLCKSVIKKVERMIDFFHLIYDFYCKEG